MNQFWLFCNSIDCRVVEFYCQEDSEKNCPACGKPGSEEAY